MSTHGPGLWAREAFGTLEWWEYDSSRWRDQGIPAQLIELFTGTHPLFFYVIAINCMGNGIYRSRCFVYTILLRFHQCEDRLEARDFFDADGSITFPLVWNLNSLSLGVIMVLAPNKSGTPRRG
ncbi:hypothetical protein BDV29DRAFT_163788 [Aspergillus leporis]|uniref:Uncharacterized protein n=1 Tax=Aspergillus leporis TaxID=41062 RepID=A0A5N5WFR5_9EURO|nr:hypothetical protein BDV29DRAFT_163788 [Aspergillus leporis]